MHARFAFGFLYGRQDDPLRVTRVHYQALFFLCMWRTVSMLLEIRTEAYFLSSINPAIIPHLPLRP